MITREKSYLHRSQHFVRDVFILGLASGAYLVLVHGSEQMEMRATAVYLVCLISHIINHQTCPKTVALVAFGTAYLTFATTLVAGETVFDCATKSSAIATYSLDDISECPPFQATYANKTKIKAQILQRGGSKSLKAYQCRLVMRREACYCSMLGNRELEITKKIFKSHLPFFASLRRPSNPSEK